MNGEVVLIENMNTHVYVLNIIVYKFEFYTSLHQEKLHIPFRWPFLPISWGNFDRGYGMY